MGKKDINVTKPFLPPKEDYENILNGIWDRNWLTNNGPLVIELEKALAKRFDIKKLLFVGNGTIALQIAIKVLKLKGEIITTPFSYIATTSSIVWENCSPVFVDIRYDTLNIDHEKIEKAITPKTSAILATHVYGNPCDIEAIELTANKYNLKVIYDAAHCFDTKYKDKSILEYGDISMISFHATKIFHTVEGGGLVTKDKQLLKEMAYMRNFGHDGPDRFHDVGINGKNSEFHAGMGLVNLQYINQVLKKYKENFDSYYELLSSYVDFPVIEDSVDWNHAYIPIVIPDANYLLPVIDELNANQIYPRRYFYPTLNHLDYVTEYDLPVSDDIEKRIICLPQYSDLKISEIISISDIIVQVLKKQL